MKNRTIYAEILKFLSRKKVKNNFYFLLSLTLSTIAYTTLSLYPLYPYFERSLDETLKNFNKTAPKSLKLSFFLHFLSSVVLVANLCMVLLLNNTKLSFLAIFWNNLSFASILAIFSSILYTFSYPIVTVLGISSSILISTCTNHYKHKIKTFSGSKNYNIFDATIIGAKENQKELKSDQTNTVSIKKDAY
ncbi:hypothetical protein BMR1_03g01990 [Babesia microti strain RI]|uniref:Uncharacterized protein n=1 Tax=Babesia microti (strain RI) TaxID=1133968 RepID=A0A0K3ANA5_BABMR|nr:hypothetical protein BMR1_03g01990 [Babesia microti strain RI]CTQ40997.1 hypothetical protein BMR1_03g01990 [Babesia microti strain RI]|eukprot:XP_012649008.1 hypothetical protein BMR1_03g01990 [Babesia microti strain RI]